VDEEINENGQAQGGDGQVREQTQIDVIARRSFDGLEIAEHRAVLDDRGGGAEHAQRDEGHAYPEREGSGGHQVPLRREQPQEQAEALDHETEGHQGEAGAVPRQQRALRREQHPRIIQVGHRYSPWS